MHSFGLHRATTPLFRDNKMLPLFISFWSVSCFFSTLILVIDVLLAKQYEQHTINMSCSSITIPTFL